MQVKIKFIIAAAFVAIVSGYRPTEVDLDGLDVSAKDAAWREEMRTYLEEQQFQRRPARPYVASAESRATEQVPDAGHHPTVQAAGDEPLCLPTNTIDGVCRADHGSVVFEKDTTYERDDLTEIILTDTTISCKKPDGFPCRLAFRFNTAAQTSFSLLSGSAISGSQVLFDSPTTVLRIDGESSISTSGRSFNPKGSATGQGASYVGQGGACGASPADMHYGDFDMLPTAADRLDMRQRNLEGSVGEHSPLNVQTGGGGHIQLNIDSLLLVGKGHQISANGLPLKDVKETDVGDLNGGSGGYVYIDTQQRYGKNSFTSVDANNITQYASIEVTGGYGKNKGAGGAGGVIVFGDGVEDQYGVFHTYTHGGRSGRKARPAQTTGSALKPEDNCGAGAAGTTYWDAEDVLLINNNWHHTTKSTFLHAKYRSPDKFPNELMPADHLILASGAVVSIKNSGVQSILFDSLQMFPLTSLIFDFDNVKELTVKYNRHFVVHNYATEIDFTRCTGEVTLKSLEQGGRGNLVNLNDVLFSTALSIDVATLILSGTIRDPLESRPRTTEVKLYATQLVVDERAAVYADNIFMYSNDTLWVKTGAVIASTQANECTTDNTGNLDLYECMPPEFDGSALTQEYILGYFNRQYKLEKMPNYDYRAHNAVRMEASILKKWNIYLLALGTVTVEDSKLSGPRIGICGNDIKIENSSVDANGRGCSAERGLAPGNQSGSCAGSGGAHGGYGGYGGAESAEPSVKAACKKSYPKPYYFGKEARYEGSGGGNGEKRSGQKDTGGAGGGIIWLTTPSTINIKNATVSADGKWGTVDNYDQYGAGGGAGGSIQMTTKNLKGDGTISTRGGAGSSNGGGGGAGGRLVMNYLKSYLSSSQPEQSYFWLGTSDIAGGTAGDMAFKFQGPGAGQNGTMHHSKCFPGYSGVFCSPCDVGQYKYDYSYGQCQPCQNKPENAYYTKQAETSSICEYECIATVEKKANNIDCLDPIELDVQRLGGNRNFFAILGLFLMISLGVFTMLTYRNQVILEELQQLSEVIYQKWDDNAERPQIRLPTEKDFSIKDETIWHHTHRMYLIGQNSISYPWNIPKDFPKNALKKDDRDKFVKFIDEENLALQWTLTEKAIFLASSIMLPPFAKQMHAFIRQSKWQKLQERLFRLFPPQFWNANDAGNNKTLRLGCSVVDHRLAYVDFLDFGQTKENWQGVQVPMPLLLAGSGTYNTPYNLDFIHDSYVKSLVLIKFDYFRNKLPVFLENFNSQLSKLSFYKLEVQVMRDLGNVVSWLEKANRSMFNHFHIKAVLYIIENQYSEVEGGVFRQKRRSFPLETVFFDAFPEMYRTLLRYVRAKLISGKSEIRLALVFKRYTMKKQIQNEMRIHQMVKDSTHQSPYQVAIDKQESVLFDEFDNDKDEQRPTIADGVNPILTAGDQSQPASDADAGSIKQEDPQVKLLDKSKRAFSISIDSSKAFELAIRKPRRKPKHHLSRVRAALYSFFLLLMKHHGSPCAGEDMTWYFVALSALVSLDIMLLVNMCIHCFYPATNMAAFGFAFWFLPPFLPLLAPCWSLYAAVTGSVSAMKTVGNLNSVIATVTIPLTMWFAYINHDDPIYIFVLVFMLLIKSALSAVSAKITQSLINPRFAQNQEQLRKILTIQQRRAKRREEVLGADVARQITGLGVFPLGRDGLQLDQEDEARLRDSLLR